MADARLEINFQEIKRLSEEREMRSAAAKKTDQQEREGEYVASKAQHFSKEAFADCRGI